MVKVSYDGRSYECGTLSVLDSLTAQGVAIPSSCHSGLCQTCLMRAVDGSVPEAAQTGLTPAQIAQQFFLACCCFPTQDLTIELPDAARQQFDAQVTELRLLCSDVLGIRLKTAQPLTYHAGQFVNLYRDEMTMRSYSLASVPALDDHLWLHVRKVPGGKMTGWLFADLKVGDNLRLSEPIGDCFYVPGRVQQNILLIATGSGLAPLYGIIRAALQQGHQGQLVLYHGSNTVEGAYLREALLALAEMHHNFRYVPCISGEAAPSGYAAGMVLDVALAEHPNLAGWRVFLCGNPLMVNAAKQQTFFAGASMSDIHADPFV